MIQATAREMGPCFHPAMGRVPIAFEPLRLGDATGCWAAIRPVASRFAYAGGGRFPSALCGRTAGLRACDQELLPGAPRRKNPFGSVAFFNPRVGIR